MAEKTQRKPRADAERNRLRLLDVARTTFAKKATAASLEEIAREAGVGIGTLYRHFPTRDALVAAMYRSDTDTIIAAAESLAAKEAPLVALRKWMRLFVDYLAQKHGISEILNALPGGPSSLYNESSDRLMDAMRTLTQRAVDSGEVKLDIDPVDLLRALAGVPAAAAKPLVDILLAGIRIPSKTARR